MLGREKNLNSNQMLRFYFMYCYLILNIYLCTFKYNNNIIKLKKRSSPSLSGRLIPEGLHIYCQDTTINLLNIFFMTQSNFFLQFPEKYRLGYLNIKN